jgi:hypothetical protein
MSWRARRRHVPEVKGYLPLIISVDLLVGAFQMFSLLLVMSFGKLLHNLPCHFHSM